MWQLLESPSAAFGRSPTQTLLFDTGKELDKSDGIAHIQVLEVTEIDIVYLKANIGRDTIALILHPIGVLSRKDFADEVVDVFGR